MVSKKSRGCHTKFWFNYERQTRGILENHAKGAVGLGFSKFEWSAGAALKISRIKHSAEPLSKYE